MARNDEGKQPNAEDRQGEKTHRAFIDSLHEKQPDSQASEASPQSENNELPIAGHHRLHEDREQHDEAEKNSEANRLRR